MEIRFWGVRGSIASPGPETASVGGNTSCVEIMCNSQRIVLDAGTGLRALGNALVATREPQSLSLLLSHFHWDHIQGLPFFVPAYMPHTKLTIVGASDGRHSLRDKLSRQMTEPHFPVQLDDLSAQLTYREARPGPERARRPGRGRPFPATSPAVRAGSGCRRRRPWCACRRCRKPVR